MGFATHPPMRMALPSTFAPHHRKDPLPPLSSQPSRVFCRYAQSLSRRRSCWGPTYSRSSSITPVQSCTFPSRTSTPVRTARLSCTGCRRHLHSSRGLSRIESSPSSSSYLPSTGIMYRQTPTLLTWQAEASVRRTWPCQHSGGQVRYGSPCLQISGHILQSPSRLFLRWSHPSVLPHLLLSSC